MICKYFLLVCELSFHFPDSVPDAQNFLSLMKSNLFFISFPIFWLLMLFGVISKKLVSNPRAQRYTCVLF